MVLGLVEIAVLRDPHLVLADVAGEDGALRRAARQVVQQLGRVDAGRGLGLRALIVPFVFRAATEAELPPRLDLRLFEILIPERVERGEVLLQAPVQEHIRLPQLGILRHVDIHVDDLGAGREGVELARRPVVEPRARHDQQVAFLHGVVRRAQPVHAQHAEIMRMVGRHGAEALERGHDRDFRALDQFAQFRHAVALRDAAADVEEGFVRLADQFVPPCAKCFRLVPISGLTLG